MQYSSRSFYIAGQVGTSETEVLLVVFRAVRAVSNSKLTVSSSDFLKQICEYIVHNCALSCNCSILFAQVRTRVFTVSSLSSFSLFFFSHFIILFCHTVESRKRRGAVFAATSSFFRQIPIKGQNASRQSLANGPIIENQ